MKLYIVRHGETVSNAKDTHQKEDDPLNESGLQQAKIVAKRFENIPIDLIITSPSSRAKKTADIISQKNNKEVIISELIKERRRPSEIFGLKYDDPVAIDVKEEIKKHLDDPSWHYSDEENFFDVKRRIEEFFEFLNLRNEENILVITHSVSMKMLLGIVMLEKYLTPEIFEELFNKLKINNTGITLFEKEEKGWKIVTWNDHAHLG